jgi:SAM-dependent MidA family methyltransferase
VSAAAAAAIQAEIARRGPIPFADFMALALGHPDAGYYAGPDARPTRGGDFLTAPELHPVFGAVVARQVAEAWERLGRPDPFTLLEYGAGAGTLALAILAGLRADGSGLVEALVYAPVELNAHRRAELGERAAAAGLALLDPARLDEAPRPGMALANEFLDALPVHLLEVRDGAPREVLVAAGDVDGFVEVLAGPGTPLDPGLGARLQALGAAGVELVEGQRLEIGLALEPWAREVGRRLGAGLVLVVDYGAPGTALYGPRRRAGTLVTYRGHVADGSVEAPYRDVGERDITAHVDTTALGDALAAAGFELLGETSQAELLAGCGLEDVLRREIGRAADAAQALELRSAVMRLLDPRHLGGFRAVLAGKGLAAGPPLRGLAFRMPRRRGAAP